MKISLNSVRSKIGAFLHKPMLNEVSILKKGQRIMLRGSIRKTGIINIIENPLNQRRQKRETGKNSFEYKMTVFNEWASLCFLPQSSEVLPNFNYAFSHYDKKGENRLENKKRKQFQTPPLSLGFVCKQSPDVFTSFIDLRSSVIRHLQRSPAFILMYQ